MEQISAGSSDISRSFGANVGITVQSGRLSLVVGRDSSPKALIQGAGGRIAMALSSTKVLAYLSLATHLAFQHDPRIAFVGPVELDQARFAHFLTMLQQGRSAGTQSPTLSTESK